MTRNEEIRAVMLTDLDFVPTDGEIEEALVAEPRIEHQAKWWGWRDEEVRTLLADELKSVHEWTTKAEGNDERNGMVRPGHTDSGTPAGVDGRAAVPGRPVRRIECGRRE